MKNYIILSLIFGIILFLYLGGPRPDYPVLSTQLPNVTNDFQQLEQEIYAAERKVKIIKPDNEAKIIWFDSANKERTPYSVVYLHGFAASQGEANPLHKEFAQRYGLNLYLPRLYGHGLFDKEPLLDLTPEKLVESAKKAIAVGKAIGEKVIIISASTGGTLALYLASENPDIHSIITYSPNIDLADSRSFILLQPWGLQLARTIVGGKYYYFEGPRNMEKYWYPKYRIEGIIALKALVKYTMTEETFRKVKQPIFVGYYYKNKDEQDEMVSVEEILEMYKELGTPDSLKRLVNFPEAGHHILPSELWSKDVGGVRRETFKFAEEVLGLEPL